MICFIIIMAVLHREDDENCRESVVDDAEGDTVLTRGKMQQMESKRIQHGTICIHVFNVWCLCTEGRVNLFRVRIKITVGEYDQ